MTARLAACLAVGALVCRAGQRDVFTKPAELTYGDPKTIAPMMAPATTFDWDRDGRADLVGRGSWWRNTGEQHDGLTLFDLGGRGAITASMVGDLDGDEFADAVVSARDSHTYQWYEDTTTEGPRRFERRGTLQWAIGGNLATPERGEVGPSVWIADLQGDGRADLLVGTRSVGLERYLPRRGPGFGVGWKDGTWLFRDMTATVWSHRNVGTRDKPAFSAGNFVRTGTGRSITFFDRADPMAVDWDGDRRRDLLVGTFASVVLFRAVAESIGGGVFDEGRLLTFGGSAALPYERRAYFPFRDERGLWHIRFGGPTASEAVQLERDDPFAFGPLRMIPFRHPDLVLDTFSVPDAVDWDGDGKLDLVVGCEDGWLWFFRNLDPKGGVERWAAPVRLEADGKPIRLDRNECLQGPCEWRWGYSNPTVADWDLDGDLDVVCGSTAETYVWFENVGTRTQPKLAARGAVRYGEGDGKPTSCAWRTRPGVGDLDGDGLPDLAGVAGNRQLCWWRRARARDGHLRLLPPAFLLGSDGEPFTVTGSVRATGRSKLAVADWDHDGRADILCSPQLGRTGFQLFFRNQGMRDGRLQLEFLPRQIRLGGHVKGWGHFAMCEPADFDGDGQWEALAGVDRGRIYYWRE